MRWDAWSCIEMERFCVESMESEAFFTAMRARRTNYCTYSSRRQTQGYGQQRPWAPNSAATRGVTI